MILFTPYNLIDYQNKWLLYSLIIQVSIICCNLISSIGILIKIYKGFIISLLMQLLIMCLFIVWGIWTLKLKTIVEYSNNKKEDVIIWPYLYDSVCSLNPGDNLFGSYGTVNLVIFFSLIVISYQIVVLIFRKIKSDKF